MKLKIVFSSEVAERLEADGFCRLENGPSRTAIGYYLQVRGRYDHDSKYPNLSVSYPAGYLDRLAEECGVSIPATRYNKTYPGEMGARGQYYAPVEGAAYRFYVPA